MSAADAAPRRPRARASARANGFTLIEMLVALAIFSLAALALLRLGGATATNSARLNDRAIAQAVARNVAVEVLSDPLPLTAAAGAGPAGQRARRKRGSSRSRSRSWPRRAGPDAPP